MRKLDLNFWLGILVIGILAGCGPNPFAGGVGSNPSTAQLSLTIRDAPPQNVTVLAFQIQVTGAVLQPGNISLLPSGNSVQIELTQLQTEAALLSTKSVPTGNYTSLALTFALPSLTILNSTNAAIGSCAAGAVCHLSPTLSPASATFSTGPNFPLTLLQGVPVGFEIDLDMNSIIQPDLSLSLAAPNAISLTQLPAAQPTTELADLGNVRGAVQSLGSNQFTLKSANGTLFTINVNNSTLFNFSANNCSANNFTCVAAGQILDVDLSLLGNGTFLAKFVELDQSAGQQVVEGMIVSVSGNPPTSLQLVVHDKQPNIANISIGDLAAVNLQNAAAFGIASRNFTLPGGLSFASASDLIVGQEVQAHVVGAVTAGLSPSFSTDQLVLFPTQVTGLVSGINLGASNFTVNGLPGVYTNAAPTPINQILVQTTTQTSFSNLTVNGLTGLSAGNRVSAEGWLFKTTGSPNPATVAGLNVRGRPLSP
jgi:hypothetical protein